MKMMISFTRGDQKYSGCYPKAEALDRCLFAILHGAKNIEWQEIPDAPIH